MTYRHFDCLCCYKCRDVVGDVFFDGTRGAFKREMFKIILLCGQSEKPGAKGVGPGLTRR
jgi:hypothetical protein